MKKNYFITLLCTLCFVGFSFGQGSESFANSNATTSYADNNFTGDGGITWTYIQSRDANGDNNGSGINLPALMLRRVASGSKVTSSTISGGIGDFSVKLYKGFTGGGDRQVELFVNGISKGTSTPFDDFDEHIFSVSNINVAGDIIIELVNITSKQVIVDDITWTASGSDPSIAITSPSDGSTIAATTSVDVMVSVTNFNVAASGTGDGYIKWSINGTPQTDKTDTNDETITVAPGNSYTIAMELVDNSGMSLTPAVTSSTAFTVNNPCDLALGTITTTCDALTSGTDTYNGSIAFTGGNTGATYTITALGATIGGDNPNSDASGTITFSGITEGTDVAITIVGTTGSSCDYERTLYSPACIAFPITEHFDYTAASNLGDQSAWTMVNSGDEMLIAAGNLDYVGLESSVGNMVKFDESGSETYTEFSDVSTGVVYASFLLKVTAFQTGSSPDVNDGGYIASLSGSTSGYDARFWIRPNPDTTGTTFDIGFGTETSSPPFTTGTYNLNNILFIVMAYDMDNALVSTWINPDATSFEGTIPTATLSSTDPNPPSAINLFILRQDSANETPFIELDALRISNSWADVTPKDATASINDNSIQGFSAYPNPITNKSFTVKTSNSSNKKVTIFNVLGKKVFSTTFSGVQKTVNIATLNSGIYILKVIEDGKSSTKKLVIK